MRKYVFLVSGILVLGGLVAYKIVASDPSKDARGGRSLLVKVQQPRRENVVYRLSFNGDVVAGQQATIFSKVTGNLEGVFVNIGSYVKKDQLLASIDSTELYQQVLQTGATFKNTEMTYQRIKELRTQNLVSKQDLENSEAAFGVARANYELAKTRLGYARVTAPFSGYVTKRYLDPGAVMSVSNTTLFTIMDIDQVKITINLLERDVPKISRNTRAVVTVDAYPGKEFTGRVSRYAESIDLATRTMAAEIDIPNPGQLLKPGMFAAVSLIVEEHPNALTIPTQALLSDDTGPYVYVVENNITRRKRLTIGNEQDSRTEILSGLNGSEFVIYLGQQLVKEGGNVTVQQ
ncbi:MAG: efflux RND transporter periplasmic adaptor subunit [Bacteroidota bacterium]